MKIQTLIDALAASEVELRLEGEHLRLRAPAGRLSGGLRAELAARKAEVVAYLRTREDQPPGSSAVDDAGDRASDGREPSAKDPGGDEPTAARADDPLAPFPLTPIQQAYWIGRSALDAEGRVSTYAYFEIDLDALDVDRLRAALIRLVARHPMLRAVVDADGQQRVVADPPPPEVPLIDLAARPPEQQADALAALREAMSHQILPADTGPLYDVRVARLGRARHRLCVGVDLLTVDVSSGMLLAEQWVALYADPRRTLPPVGLTFRDYVLGERDREAGAAGARRWWAERAPELPPPPALPWAAVPDGAPVRTVRLTATLDGPRWAALQRGARARGITPAAALCAAYAETLARWSRRAPMTLNLTVFDRRPVHPDVDRVVGDFTNTLLLAVDPGPRASFAERARAIQGELWQALEHAAVSGVEVLRMLNRGRARGREVRMPVVFTAALRPDGRPPIAPAISDGFDRLGYGVSQTPQVWLDHQAVELGERLLLNWDAVDARFPPGLLDAMFAAYTGLLEALATEEATWDAPAEVRPPGSADRWARYNETAGPAGEGTLWQLVDRAGQAHPDRPAIIAPDRTLTHRELAERAAAVHRRLGDLKPGTRVAIVMRRHWAQAVAAAGVLRAGGAYVPLDAAWPAARIEGVLREGGITRVLTTTDIMASHPAFDATAGRGADAIDPRGGSDADDMDGMFDVMPVDAIEPSADAPLPAPQAPARLAYVIYTSGSTGKPKGVMIDHRGAVNTVCDINRRLGAGPDDRVLALSSLGFDLSVYDLFGLLGVGGAVVLPPADADRDPARWVERMRSSRVTLWNTVPALMAMLVEHLEQTGGYLPDGLRHVMLSGDWIPVTLPDRIRSLADEPPAITSLGGATEASIWSIAHPIGVVDDTRPSIPYGRPLDNQRMYVLDPYGRPCPIWAVGEIHIGGAGVALGYADDPDQTAARFFEHPRTGERLYRTGDLGRLWPDETMEFLGREDGQVKVGGHRIELGEIDAALGRHPSLRAAVTVAAGEPPGPRRLVAYVVPEARPVADGPLPIEHWPVAFDPALPAAWDAFEAQCVAAMCHTLRRLGALDAVGAIGSPESLAASGRIEPSMGQVLEIWMGLLADRGLLARVGSGRYRAVRPLPAAPPDWSAVPRVDGLPDAAVALAEAFADRHLDLLAGRCTAQEVAFPDGDLGRMAAIYAELAPMRADTERLARVVLRLADEAAADRPLRVFEVGAGTGSASRAIVGALGAGRLEYLATDVSPVFAEGIRAILGDAGRYALFDMDRDLEGQGVAAGAWDVVIAHQVLHNARAPGPTLARLSALLAPGGQLLVTEAAGDGPFAATGPSFLGVSGEHGAHRAHLLDDGSWRAAFAEAGLRPVIVRADTDAGPFGRMRLFIASRTEALDRDALRADLARILPGYMVPDAFVALDALPLTATGKVDRRRLPSPDLPAARERVAVAPRSPVEEALVELWSAALGRDGLGVHDDFFESGGDSLSAVRLVGRIRRRFGVELPLRRFFAHATIAGLAPLCAASEAPSTPDLPQIEPDPARRFEPFPLTEVQHAYWLGQQGGLELGGAPCQVYLEFTTPALDPARFEAAVRAVVARHDALRSTVGRDGRQQTLREVPPYRVAVDDARGPDGQGRLAETRRAMREAAGDPGVWPLFEFRLTRLPGEWRVHWRQDALFADGWSIFLIGRELDAIYARSPLPPAPTLTFRDYVQSLSAVRQTPAWREASDWWDARLDTLPPAPDLPLACDPASLGVPRFARAFAELSAPRWKRLRAAAERLKVTPSTVLLVAFARVLAGWSRHPHFTLNLTLFNRLPVHADVDRLVGDFTTLSLLECDVRADEPPARAAARLQAQLWADLDRRMVGAVEVIRRLAARTADGPRARMPIVFTSTLGFDLDGAAGGPFGRLVEGSSQTPQVWLDHQVWTADGALCLSWDTVEGLFPPGVVDAMFDAYVRTVRCLADDVGAWQDADALPELLPGAQRARRAALVATEAPRPAGLLHQGLFEQARRTPDAPAVIGEDGAVLSYGALTARARALADALVALGVQPGERVAVLLPKGPAQTVALVAALDAGAVYVPIDPGQPARRVGRMLAACGARRAVVSPDFGGLPASTRPVAVHPAGWPIGGADPGDAPPAFRARCAPDALAYVIFTSGSTGAPKGVMIEHRAALNTVHDVATRYAWTAHDRVFGLSRAGFDLSVQDVFGTLAVGAALVLPAPDAMRDPARWAAAVEATGVTIWNTVPTLMDMLVTHVEARGGHLSGLRLVMLSGDWIPTSLPDRVRALAPGAAVISLGGATEASIWSIAHPIDRVEPEWTSIPYGRPLTNQRLYVLGDDLRLRPDHAVGEIHIAGEGLARGYISRPEETAARFVAHPRTGERLYRTGDLGRYRPEGDIEFLGRRDHQVKIGGHRVELGEIEAALQARPAVERAVVLAVGDPRGARRLAAYVVPSTGASAQGASREPQEMDARTALRLSRPGRRRDLADAPQVALPSDAGDAIRAARWHARRSVRRFDAAPVGLAALGGLLAELCPLFSAGRPLPKYRYPSAGDLYPVQAYVAVHPGRVEGVEGGLYYHDADRHALRRLADVMPDADWHHPRNRAMAAAAAFTVILVAREAPVRQSYGPLAEGFCHLEAGYIGQLLMERAAAAGIGVCPVGGFDPGTLPERLGLADGDRVVHALVGGLPAVDDGAETAEPAALRAQLSEVLPGYMVPDTITVLDALPLSANGKVDRAALPRPDARRSAPRLAGTVTEATLADMVGRLIDISPVPVDRNLFELGCSSLHIVQLHNRLFDDLGIDLPITTIFRRPTIAELARELAQTMPEPTAPAAPPVSASTPLAPTPPAPTPPAPTPLAAAPEPGPPPRDTVSASRPTAPAESAGARSAAYTGPPEAPSDLRDAPIAIVGVACRFPGAPDAAAFRRNVRAGIVSIAFFDPETLDTVDPETRRAPDFVAASPMLDDIFHFDADFFGYSPREAELLDPQKRLFLEQALRALEDAGIAPDDPPGPIGLYAGDSLSYYLFTDLKLNPSGSPTPQAFQAFVGNDKDYLATQTAYRLGLEGPAVSVGTACSTSLVAVHMACQALRAGECAVALAGGATVRVPQRSGYRPTMDGMYSVDGRCRPFDAESSGTVFGSGVGLVVLRPLADALADGDRVLAVLRGSAIGNDGGQRAGFTAPGHDGQVRVIRSALARAGVDPATIDYVEAHGTGTRLGDPIEVAALAEAYGPLSRSSDRPVRLGAVKANVGHLEAAAGVAGLIKVAQALHAAELPPQPEFGAPNPRIPFDRIPFAVGVQRAPWPAAKHPRRAAVSAFGIGGTNAHAVLEAAPDRPATTDDGRPRLLPLSARTPEALRRLAGDMIEHLDLSEATLRDTCYTAGVGRNHHTHRLAVVAEDRESLHQRLTAFVEGRAARGVVLGERWIDGDAPMPERHDLPGLFAVAGAWVAGARVDWRALYAGERRVKVPLPGHPLDPRPHRVSAPLAPPAASAPPPATPLHPAIDRVVRGPRAFVAEGALSCERLPWVADHIIDGRPLLPGVAWLETCRAAAEAWADGAALRLEDVVFEAPLVVPMTAADAVDVHVIIESTAGGEAAFEAHARGPDGWIRHVSGRVVPDDSPPPRAEPMPDGESIDVAALFEWMSGRRLDYGPRMRAIASVQVVDAGVSGRVQRPAIEPADHGWAAHPAMLDGALQSGAALGMADGAGDGAMRVPAGVRRYRLYRPVPDTARIRLRLDPPDAAGDVEGTIGLYDEAGACLARFEGMRFRRFGGAGRPAGMFGVHWTPAARPATQAGAAGRWLLIGPEADPPLGEELRALDADVKHVADVNTAIDQLGTDPIDGLILRVDRVDGPDAATAAVAAARALIAALVERRAALPRGLWFVTRGATAAGSEDHLPHPSQAALVGLARVCAIEHPELGAAAIDLDPLGDPDERDGLIGELLGEAREPVVALRRSGRSVPRLRVDQGPPPAPAGLPADDRPWRLAVTARGDLEGLHFVEPDHVANAGDALPDGAVEVRVHATGLNFRDVLNVLGMYPGDPGPVGLEMAGVVARVGEGVSRVAVGDRVFGLGTDAFADRVRTDERMLARLPSSLTMAQGAGLALTGCTVHECLFDHARLERGQRILIHAAAGGVGLMAVAFARAIGAEVFATASPAKWPALRRLGIEHIYHSRTTDFAAAVLAGTDGQGVDVVLNSLGIDGLGASFEATRSGGVVVDIAKGDAAALRARFADRRYVAYDLSDSTIGDRDHLARTLDRLAEWVADGALARPPLRIWPVERTVDAFRYMARARHIGKIIVSQAARRRRLAGWPGRVPPGAVIITGGLGDLGLATARWFAERGAERLVLVGRRGVRTDAQREAVAALEAAGTTVRIEAADVAAPGIAEALIDRVGSPLAGVVHAAGVLDDAPLIELDDARIAAVLAPKLHGGWALHRATAERELSFFVLYGSSTALVGNAAQGPYVAGNAALAALAHHRQGLGLPATVIDWGPWAEIGMAARLHATQQARLNASGVRPIHPAHALAALEQALADDRTRVAVMPFDAAALHGPAPAIFAELVGRGDDGGDDLAARMAGLDRDARARQAADYVVELVTRVLGLDPAAGIDPDRPLAELGVDSLISIELRNAMGRSLGRPLSATALFEYPTVSALAGWLADLVGPDASGEGDAARSAPAERSESDDSAMASGMASSDVDDGDDLSALGDDALAALLRAELDDEDAP